MSDQQQKNNSQKMKEADNKSRSKKRIQPLSFEEQVYRDEDQDIDDQYKEQQPNESSMGSEQQMLYERSSEQFSIVRQNKGKRQEKQNKKMRKKQEEDDDEQAPKYNKNKNQSLKQTIQQIYKETQEQKKRVQQLQQLKKSVKQNNKRIKMRVQQALVRFKEQKRIQDEVVYKFQKVKAYTTRSKNKLKIDEVLSLFYNKQNYSKKSVYFQKLSLFSNKMQQFFSQKDQMYVNRLKILFYQRFKASTQDFNQVDQVLQAWHLISDYFFGLLENKHFFFLAFKFEDDYVEKIYRNFLIKCVFNKTISILIQMNEEEEKKSEAQPEQQMLMMKKNQKMRVKKKVSNLEELLTKKGDQDDKYLLYILSARQSFINYDVQLKRDLQKLTKTIRNSWYLRIALLKFFKGRSNKLNFMNAKNQVVEITQELIKQKLRQVSIFFVDFPDPRQGGQTYTLDPYLGFPIFINTFKQFSDHNYNRNLIKSYSLGTITHEVEHCIGRKSKVIKPQERSYPSDEDIKIPLEKYDFNSCINTKSKRKEIEDGGWLFENFVFGGRMDYFGEFDYELVKDLLQIQQNPFPEDDLQSLIGNMSFCQNFVISDQRFQNEVFKRIQLYQFEKKDLNQKTSDNTDPTYENKRVKDKIQQYIKSSEQKIKKLKVRNQHLQKESVNNQQSIIKFFQNKFNKINKIKQEEDNDRRQRLENLKQKLKQQTEKKYNGQLQNQQVSQEHKEYSSQRIQSGQNGTDKKGLKRQEIANMIRIIQSFGSKQRDEYYFQKRNEKWISRKRQYQSGENITFIKAKPKRCISIIPPPPKK